MNYQGLDSSCQEIRFFFRGLLRVGERRKWSVSEIRSQNTECKLKN